ncbi:MAG: BtpA/SgcQ family protein [Oscillospiraceae bacterium]|jgi:membrane complex biogenesis BtpA family protein
MAKMFEENKGKKLIFGLVHLLPLPGTPFYEEGLLQKSLDKALRDAEALQKGGASGCLVQSVDRVFGNTDETDPARVAAITMIASKVRDLVGPDFKVGVQLMWNNITPSLAACKAVGADFTRCTAFIGSTISKFGPIEGNPLKVMEYRRKIHAEDIAMISEVSGYHHLGEYNKAALQDLARSSINCGADAVEVMSRDEKMNETLCRDIKETGFREPGDIPIILGGGTDVENCQRRLKYADGALVGRAFEDGNWGGNIDSSTVAKYMEKVHAMEG